MKHKTAEDFPAFMQAKGNKTVIAVDYDGTLTLSPKAWDIAIKAWQDAGISVIIVTMRFKNETPEDLDPNLPIIYTGRKAKKSFVENLGIKPDVWCDDNPQFIFQDAWLGVENAGHLNQWDHPDYAVLRTTTEETNFW